MGNRKRDSEEREQASIMGTQEPLASKGIRLFPSVGKSLQLNCIVNELQLTEVIVNFEGKV